MERNLYAQIFNQLKTNPISTISNIALLKCLFGLTSVQQKRKNKVAKILIDGNNPNIPFELELIIHEHSRYKHKVKHYFHCYDSLQYRLLF